MHPCTRIRYHLFYSDEGWVYLRILNASMTFGCWYQREKFVSALYLSLFCLILAPFSSLSSTLHPSPVSQVSHPSERVTFSHSVAAIPTCMLMTYRAIIMMQHNKGQVRRCQRLFVSFSLSLSLFLLLLASKAVQGQGQSTFYPLLIAISSLFHLANACLLSESFAWAVDRPNVRSPYLTYIHSQSQIFTLDDSINCTQKTLIVQVELLPLVWIQLSPCVSLNKWIRHMSSHSIQLTAFSFPLSPHSSHSLLFNVHCSLFNVHCSVSQ